MTPAQRTAMAAKGRYGDSRMAHVTPGEAVVPRDILANNPALALHIVRAIHAAGGDPRRYIVGTQQNSKNPDTGHEEYFGNFWKHGIGKILGIAAPIAASFIPGIGPLASAALGAGIGGITGGIKGAVTGGVTAGLGNFTSGAVGGASGILGDIGGIAKDLGPVGQILGAVNSLSGTMGGQQQTATPKPIKAAQATVFNPTQPAAMGLPASLSSLAEFTPDQQRSSLATKGVNTGLGQEENNYYKNLLQRSLIGDNNQVTGNPNFLSPIESQYFSQQGYNTSDPMKFLQGLQA